jgi:general secretion pathway protein G
MRKLSRGRGKRQGFTLLELLVVMVIIGLLAGLVAPRYFAQVGKSQVKIARSQIDALEKALDQYRIDMGRYPTTEERKRRLDQLVARACNFAPKPWIPTAGC